MTRAAAALLAALLAFGGWWPASALAAIPEPADDPFYDTPGGLKSRAPGAVLRSREVQVTGAGVPIPARSWQVLYRTTDTKGRAVATVATIIVPLAPYLGGAKRPLVSYQTAIDSLAARCNPSYRMRKGDEKEMPAILEALNNGWAVVVSDYEGPRYAYTAGLMAGRAVLDGVRAAERFGPAGLSGSKTPVGFWGYSGGGHRKIGDECSDTLITGYPGRRMREFTKPGFPDPLVVRRVRRVIRKDSLPQATPTAPIYLYHTSLDELIPVAGPDRLFRQYCHRGVKVFYERGASGDHVAYAFTAAPGALQYLSDRFAGRPAPSNCAG